LQTESTDNPANKSEARSLGWVYVIILPAGGFLILLTLLSFAGAFWWVANLTDQFRLHIGLAGILLAAIQLLFRPRLFALAWVSIAVVNFLVIGLEQRTTAPPLNGNVDLKVMTFNVNAGNRAIGELTQTIETSDADLVFLQEVTPYLWRLIQPDLRTYKRHTAILRDDSRGIVLLVRSAGNLQIQATEHLVHSDPRGRPFLEVMATAGEDQINILSVHTKRLGSYRYDRIQLNEFDWIESWEREISKRHPGTPILVLGDFNCVPWSASPNRLRGRTELTSIQRNLTKNTWPTRIPEFLGITIDYGFCTPNIEARQKVINCDSDSDHRPIRIDLAWP
jgi:endonuclease/exonuclease/phosphatase (EEP) superfamily protein YafD